LAQNGLAGKIGKDYNHRMANAETGLREEILQTANKLFIEHGYTGLSMREISEALGVSKAALYYYYKDKEQLFLAILKAYLDEMETAIDQILARPVSGKEQIRLFVEYVLTQPAEKRATIRLASQEIAQISAPARQAFDQIYREKFINKVRVILVAGMEHGEFRQIPAETAVWALLGIMFPYFYPAHNGNTFLSAETIHEIVTIYLHGISL
jgi:AcrR family transcriptional regulator